MSIKHMQEYRDPEISKGLIESLWRSSNRPVRLMEVCGTHTMSVFKNGIRSVLPENITLVSGPGCPVCVIPQNEIDAFIELSMIENVIITTFGDLIRVPGTQSSLQRERAMGKDIRVVYSSLDSLDIARQNPDKKVVFLGVGFETTAPTIAASIVMAREDNIANYHVFSAHKLVPPVLAGLMEMPDVRVDGFMLPGHVSVIIGSDAYMPFVERFHTPCVIAGFEPADILHAISMLAEQIESGFGRLENAYTRAVTPKGNQKALALINQVFETVNTCWRGIGIVPLSGLKIREKFAAFDAEQVFKISVSDSVVQTGCVCGEILTGIKSPPDCPLYKMLCTPTEPIGPCMVSSEGTCAAFYRYYF